MSVDISLKVDVCNRRALEQGVPRLLRLLEEFEVRASFFVTFGPDHSGRAIRRLFRPGFLKKMLRTRAPATYGIKTLLYGTLLPGPPVGEGLPQLLRQIRDGGHEIGIHGWDHVGWHDGLSRMTEPQVRESMARAVRLFEQGLESPPLYSGAPGWQVTGASLRIQEGFGFKFASDCRGRHPFYPLVDGAALRTLQIPTTLPTSDEVLGTAGLTVENLADYYRSNIMEDRVNVLGLHAEIEGIGSMGWLRDFLSKSRLDDDRFLLLDEVARRAGSTAPAEPIIQKEIPGRAGAVACQGGGSDHP